MIMATHSGRSRARNPQSSNSRSRNGQSRSAPSRNGRSGNSQSRNAPRRRPSGPKQSNQRPAARPRTSALETALDAAAATTVVDRTFAELGLPGALVDELAAHRLVTPTPVQNRTIPDALAGRDVLGRARTGSGKTLAFGLPLIARLVDQNRPPQSGHPRALVLTPTRELAQQVADALRPHARRFGLSVLAIYGGTAMGKQTTALKSGVDIVVATPGRLEDHIARGTCSLSRVAVLVLDEADHMADLGFLPAVTRIVKAVPADCQRLLFSATLDRGVEALAAAHLTDPAIHSAPVEAAPKMEHRAFTVEKEQKVEVAARVASRDGRSLFFVRTKHGADRLAKQLRQRGIEAGAIHGNRSQSQRQRALSDFASGRRPVLVATDVAARGIHVDEVELVVHYDPPGDHKDFLHRSGRTARAGREGLVLSLLLAGEEADHRQVQRRADAAADMVPVHPDHAEVRRIAGGGTPIVVTAEEPPHAPPNRPRSHRSSQRRRRRA